MDKVYANPVGIINSQQVEHIINLLKYSYLLEGEIARQFKIKPCIVSKINKGEIYKLKNEAYPIRKWKSRKVASFTYEQVTEIIELLKNSSLSLNKIAKLYNVNVQAIQGINNGSSKKYRRDEITYPIRSY